MATHSSTLAWKIPRTEEPGRLQSMGSQSDTTEQLHFHFFYSYTMKIPISRPKEKPVISAFITPTAECP